MKSAHETVRSVLPAVVAMMIALVTISCQPTTRNQVTEERAKAIASQYLDARNTANLDLLDDIYAPDVVVHDCSMPEDIRGLEALKALYQTTHAGFPDLHSSFDGVFVADDQIVFRWVFEATHTGNLRGIPPTGRHVRFSGVAIDRIENDKIVEEWVDFNVLDLLQQMGFTVVPPSVESSEE